MRNSSLNGRAISSWMERGDNGVGEPWNGDECGWEASLERVWCEEKGRHLQFGFPVLGLGTTIGRQLPAIMAFLGAEPGLSTAHFRPQASSVEEATLLKVDRDLEVALKERRKKQDIVQIQNLFSSLPPFPTHGPDLSTWKKLVSFHLGTTSHVGLTQ